MFGQTDGGLYVSSYSTNWYHQIYGDFRTGQMAIRGKNSGTWQSWRTVLDSGNSTNYNSAGIYAGGGNVIQSTSGGTSYQNHIQVRETAGYGGNTSFSYAPALGFHWSGVVASNIAMEASGRIAITNNPGTSYENFIANYLYGARFALTNSSNSAYITGNSDWGMRMVNDNGYIQFGPANNSWAHIYSDRAFYMNQDLYLYGNRVYADNYRPYADSAGSVSWGGVTSKPAGWLNTTNLIDSNTPGSTVNAVPSGFYQDYAGSGNPTGTWFNYVNVRHSNPANVHGFQIGMSYYDNNLWFRSYQGGGSAQAWSRALGTNTDPYPSNMNQYVGTGNNPTFYGLNLSTSGTAQDWYANGGWFRVYGSQGLYFNDYGWGICAPARQGASYSNIFTYGNNGSYNGYGICDSSSWLTHLMYSGGGYGGIYSQTWGDWHFYWNQSNTCLGIGGSPTSSSYRLYVNGKGIYSDGDVVAYSDVRKKTDIVTIDNALDRVLNLRGVFYVRTDKMEEGRKTGVIAQETEKVLPEVVTYAADVDEYGVSYGNMAGVLIEAIKELNAKIAHLESQLASK